MANWLTRIFGSRNQRLVSQYNGLVRKINAFEPALEALSDADLAARTVAFREQLAAGKTLDDLLPEAFAVVREASRRTLGLRHFDVQLIGGMVLNNGKIAEMRTGEGKTLVATLPAYLNALTGKGAHIVTVNEYLAQRDADWMAPIFNFLGMTVGVVKAGQMPDEKRAAYGSDITYGTNNEFGFDYLRDNLAFRIEDRMQRELSFAVVDEVDSILIDEARTPLIISGPAEESTELYLKINELVPRLSKQETEEGEGDFWADEKSKQVHLSDQGHEHVEDLFLEAGLLQQGQSLYDPANIRLMHHLNAALRAHAMYRKDVEYIVRAGEVIIVDEFTGRTMPGRRWSDGLHQAVEAKEGVRVREENQTVASITFQNFFRMYGKLSGMTGTADTEAFEFQQIYGLEVVVIPTHRPMIRNDAADLVYLTQKDKYEAIIEDIRECSKRGQPALVGTTSVETSELLSNLLQKQGIAHNVLNAKQHDREARSSRRPGGPARSRSPPTWPAAAPTSCWAAVSRPSSRRSTRRTRPCAPRPRPTGSSRHEAGGRGGRPAHHRHRAPRVAPHRQPAARPFGPPGRPGLLALLPVARRQPDAHLRRPRAHQALADDRRHEGRRGHREQDAVAPDRARAAQGRGVQLRPAQEPARVRRRRQRPAQGRLPAAHRADGGRGHRGLDHRHPRRSGQQHHRPVRAAREPGGGMEARRASRKRSSATSSRRSIRRAGSPPTTTSTRPSLRERVVKAVEDAYAAKVEAVGAPVMRHLEKAVMLQELDRHWREHLAAMDYLRQGIHLRAYAQKNPKQEYKREAFELFGALLDRIKHDTVSLLSRLQVRNEAEIEEQERERERQMARQLQTQHASPQSVIASDGLAEGAAAPPAVAWARRLRHPRVLPADSRAANRPGQPSRAGRR